MQSTTSSKSIGGYENAVHRAAGDELRRTTQSRASADTVTFVCSPLGDEVTFFMALFKVRFFVIRGMRSAMSVAVYWRTSEEKTIPRSPVPALWRVYS